MSFTDDAYPNYLVWHAPTFEWRGQATAPSTHEPAFLYLSARADGTRTYKLGNGCIMPYDTSMWCKLQFEAGIVRDQDGEEPPASPNYGAMDVCIVVDVTGSMGGAIQSLRSELTKVALDVVAASGGDYRLALVGAGDVVTVHVPFAQNNIAAMQAALATLQVPYALESVTEALKAAVYARTAGTYTGRAPGEQVGDFVAFRANARKIIVVVTDTMPQQFGGIGGDNYFTMAEDGAAIQGVLEDASTQGIRVSSVFVPTGGIEHYEGGYVGTEKNVALMLQNYAATTNGLYFRVSQDGSGTATALRDVIITGGGDIPAPSPVDATSGFARPLPCCSSALCAIDGRDPGGGGNITIGDGPPTPGSGQNCDYYYDRVAAQVWKKMRGGWVLIAGASTSIAVLVGDALPATADPETYFVWLTRVEIYVYLGAQWINVWEIACESGPGGIIDPNEPDRYHDYDPVDDVDPGDGYGPPSCDPNKPRFQLPPYRPARRVGVLRYPEIGEYSRAVRGIRLDARNEAAMQDASARIAGLWVAPNTEIPIAEKPLEFLTTADKAHLEKAEIPLVYGRDFYFASPVRFFSLVWIVSALDARPEEVRISLIE